MQCSGCAACENTTTTCIACPTDFFLDLRDNLCYTTCNLNYYGNKLNNRCAPCHPACLNCTDGTTDTCTLCNNTGVTYFLNLVGGATQCTLSCPTGTWRNPTGQTYNGSTFGFCSSCNFPCLNCQPDNGNLCTSCQPGTYMNSSLSTECDSGCSDGYYADNTTNKCRMCNAMCTKCKDATTSNCQSCSNNFFLVLSNNTCVSS